MPRSREGSVHGILILAQFCFASLAVIGRLALGHVPPNAMMFTRVVGGALVFYLIGRARGAITLLERRDVPRLVGCALLGIVVNQFLFLNGLARTTATNASTYDDFPDSNWSEPGIVCHGAICVGRICRPNPDPAIRITLSSAVGPRR